jgi:hypothetical protein
MATEAWPKGRRRKRKLKATYFWQMATKSGVGGCLFFFLFFFFSFFCGVFVCFSTRRVKKHHKKKKMGEVHVNVKNFWPFGRKS